MFDIYALSNNQWVLLAIDREPITSILNRKFLKWRKYKIYFIICIHFPYLTFYKVKCYSSL